MGQADLRQDDECPACLDPLQRSSSVQQDCVWRRSRDRQELIGSWCLLTASQSRTTDNQGLRLVVCDESYYLREKEQFKRKSVDGWLSKVFRYGHASYADRHWWLGQADVWAAKQTESSLHFRLSDVARQLLSPGEPRYNDEELQVLQPDRQLDQEYQLCLKLEACKGAR